LSPLRLVTRIPGASPGDEAAVLEAVVVWVSVFSMVLGANGDGRGQDGRRHRAPHVLVRGELDWRPLGRRALRATDDRSERLRAPYVVRLPRGCWSYPSAVVSPRAGAGRSSDFVSAPGDVPGFLLSTASWAALLVSDRACRRQRESAVLVVGVVLAYRCGAVPDSHRVPFWVRARTRGHQHGPVGTCRGGDCQATGGGVTYAPPQSVVVLHRARDLARSRSDPSPDGSRKARSSRATRLTRTWGAGAG
jgi:hypothetical protein